VLLVALTQHARRWLADPATFHAGASWMLDSKAEEEARDARKGSEVPSKQVRRVCVNEGDRTPSIGVAGVYVLTNKLLLTIYYKLRPRLDAKIFWFWYCSSVVCI